MKGEASVPEATAVGWRVTQRSGEEGHRQPRPRDECSSVDVRAAGREGGSGGSEGLS